MIISGRGYYSKGRPREGPPSERTEDQGDLDPVEEDDDDEDDDHDDEDDDDKEEEDDDDKEEEDDDDEDEEEEDSEPGTETHILYLECIVTDCEFLVHSGEEDDPPGI
jgi:hypothetical protein